MTSGISVFISKFSLMPHFDVVKITIYLISTISVQM